MRLIAALCLSVCFACGPEPEEAQLGPKIEPVEIILGDLYGLPVTLVREDPDGVDIIAETDERVFMARLIHNGEGLAGQSFLGMMRCEGPALDYWTEDAYTSAAPVSWDGEVVEFGHDGSWAVVDVD